MAIEPLMDEARKSLLLDCSSRFDQSGNLLLIDMHVREEIAYESLKRVEISIRDISGKELFRAMNNRSSKCAPIPPNAFGIYPVGEKKNPSLKDVKSAGMEAAIPVRSKYGNLAKGCMTSWNNGILNIYWQVHPVGWQCPDGRGYIFVKIVPRNKTRPFWRCCGFLLLHRH